MRLFLERERAAGREPDVRSWHALEVATAFAEGSATRADLGAAWDAANGAARAVTRAAAWHAAEAAAWDAARDAERKWQTTELLRVLFPENGAGAVQLFVPGRLHSRLNGSASRAHWSRISEAARRWRHAATVSWLAAGKPTWAGPATVTFTAYVGRLWDTDNLPAALKSVRDQVVRDVLGTDDGPTCGHVFTYAQTVERGKRGVLVQITPREGA